MSDKPSATLDAFDDLLRAMKAARDALYNGFEPDNQSRAYHAADEAVKKAGAARTSLLSETGLKWTPGEPRVVCAAIRDKLGRIIAGARHFDQVMIAQIRRTTPDQDAFRTAEQGFIDQFGNFLTREEAMVLATKWGQIIRDDEGRQSLYSENLY